MFNYTLKQIFYVNGAPSLPKFLLLLHIFFSTKRKVKVDYVYFCVIYLATYLRCRGYMLGIET